MKGSSLPVARRLEGKVSLITGGASGIGESAARLFANHGAKVFIADIQDDLGRSVCNDLRSGGDVEVWYVHCDVSKESDIENAVNQVVAKYGKLDILFSNAGIGGSWSSARISEVEYEEYKRILDVNLFGCIAAAKYAARVMIPAKKGSILFTASAASVTYGSISYPYLASKHAVVGLTKNLSIELGKHGIRVNCISPFLVATPLLLRDSGVIHKEKLSKWIQKIGNLKGTVLESKDVAYAALYLASDEANYVSGTNLVIDGGKCNDNGDFFGMAVRKGSSKI